MRYQYRLSWPHGSLGSSFRDHSLQPGELCNPTRAEAHLSSDLASMPRLKVIVRTGVGYDRVDREACAARGITLHNTPESVPCSGCAPS